MCDLQRGEWRCFQRNRVQECGRVFEGVEKYFLTFLNFFEAYKRFSENIYKNTPLHRAAGVVPNIIWRNIYVRKFRTY